jgi:ABC-type sugar transport system substrate-binding protein
MKLALVSGTLILPVLLCLGCGHRTNNRTISAIPQSVSQEIFLTERAGMQEEASDLGLRIDWDGPGAAEPQRQVDLIIRATRERRYGIAITPAGGAAIDTALQDALQRGIPVVTLRDATSLGEQQHLSFVLEDYQAGAQIVSERLRNKFGCQGTVVIVGVNNYSENSVRRLDAVEGSIRRNCPSLKIAKPVVAPFGSGYVQIAAKRALHDYPDLVSFIALNARAGLGAEAVVESDTLSSRIAVITFDPSFPLLLRLRRGYVDAIIAQNMRGMGKRAVENIAADHNGQAYNHTITLSPMLITKDNIDAPATQDWLQFNLNHPL